MENEKNTSELRYQEPENTGKKRPVHTTPYDKEIEKHMKSLFPDRKERVFYEQTSDLLQIDIHLLEAPTKKDFHVLYTVGMSALAMKLPEDLLPQYKALERAELMLLLPSEWNLSLPEDGNDESTALCGVMLGALQEEISVMQGKDGTQINFYTLIPLFKEEIEGKQKEGTEALITKLSSLNGFGMIIFPDRPCVY